MKRLVSSGHWPLCSSTNMFSISKHVFLSTFKMRSMVTIVAMCCKDNVGVAEVTRMLRVSLLTFMLLLISLRIFQNTLEKQGSSIPVKSVVMRPSESTNGGLCLSTFAPLGCSFHVKKQAPAPDP